MADSIIFLMTTTGFDAKRVWVLARDGTFAERLHKTWWWLLHIPSQPHQPEELNRQIAEVELIPRKPMPGR
jgi:hypothetical protein